MSELVDLPPVRQQVILKRQYPQTLQQTIQMTELTQIADPALGQGDALYLVQVVDLGPYFVEANELDHDLLGLLDGVEVRLGIVLHLMHLLHHRLAPRVPFLLRLFLQLLLHLLEVVVEILRVVQLLRPEVPLEQRSLQPVAELDLFVLDHRALVVRTGEVGVAVDRAVVLAAVGLVPLNADPQFILGVGGRALMLQGAEIPHNPTTVIEQYLPSFQLVPILQVIRLQSLSLGLEEERLDLVLLPHFLIPHGRHRLRLLVCLGRQAFHYSPPIQIRNSKLLKNYSGQSLFNHIRTDAGRSPLIFRSSVSSPLLIL